MDNIIESVCNFFEIEKEKVIEKGNNHHISLVRNYIYYILHYDYGYSVGNIAKKFSRCRREVNYRVSEMKYRIGYFLMYKEQYNGIKESIEKAKES